MAMKVTAHKVTPYIIMDFETGGLDMSVCGLTEVAMISVKGDTLEKINEYESIIQPHQVLKNGKWVDAQYTEGAEKVTGLSQAKLKLLGDPMEEVAKAVVEKLEEANVYKSKTGYKPVLIAHNAQFEVKCLQNLAAGRFDLSKYFHGQEDFYGNFAPHYIDTLDLAKLLWAPNTRQTAYKLSDVMDRAGIPLVDAHRAMNDVKPSAQFFEYVIRLLRVAEKRGLLTAAATTHVDEETGEEIKSNDRSFKFQFN